ncbi:MAG: insulinase family protein, partial [Bacteroidota bacterium]
YGWPTIGYMPDLTAASYDDVVEFFRNYYGPNNASLVIAGAIDPVRTRSLVEKWFSDVARGRPVFPMDPPAAYLHGERRLLYEDRVQLPRLYMVWHTPAIFAPGDAELDILSSVLTGGKNSRLYKRLVYDLQIAQDVTSFQASSQLSSAFWIMATARAGHTLAELEAVIGEELKRIQREEPAIRELERAVNQYEAGFIRRLELVGGFNGKANQLNSYFFHTGNPDYFQEDLARYRALDPKDVSAVAVTHLRDDGRVVLSIVPNGKKDLGAGGTEVKPQ